ncbi:MAG: hypothetical protein WB679_02050 [Terracidiphilus sp.]
MLDWSDGALMALHFAMRESRHDKDARVYVLEPDRLNDKLNALPDAKIGAQEWESYVKAHPSADDDEEDWETRYLPGISEANPEINVPRTPFVLEFPHINRRIAAQRSRFVVLGTEPHWMVEEFERDDSTIRLIVIPSAKREEMRQGLRDCGVTESVIFPDLDGLGREMKQLWELRKKS